MGFNSRGEEYKCSGKKFEVHVISQEGVDGEMEVYQFIVFSGINNSSNFLTYN